MSEIVFFKSLAESECFKLLFGFKKDLYKVKVSGQHLRLYINLEKTLNWINKKKRKEKLYHTSDCWFRDMLNLDFLEKCLGLASPLHFVYFLCYILLTDQISLFWLPLFLEILGNMCIVITCFPVCDVIHFKIIHSFVFKPVSCMTKKVKRRAFNTK